MEKIEDKAADAGATPTEPEKPTPAAEAPVAGSGAKYGDEEEEEAKTTKLQGTKVVSSEEGETLIYIHKAKLYRFRDGKWKERGHGYCKLLRSSDNKIRFLLRTEKTLTVSANFLIAESPLCDLKEMNNNDKAWLWGCMDGSDGEPTLEKLAIRFRTAEEATEFKAAFEAAKQFNLDAKAGNTDKLVFAEAVEDIKEELDDPDENVTAES
jgi:hypothetical protein